MIVNLKRKLAFGFPGVRLHAFLDAVKPGYGSQPVDTFWFGLDFSTMWVVIIFLFFVSRRIGEKNTKTSNNARTSRTQPTYSLLLT